MIITLKDTKKEFESPMSCMEIAKSISEGLARVAVCAKVDGVLKDLSNIVDKDCQVEIVTFSSEEGAKIFRHSSSHLLAQAVKRIFPTAKLGIGPAITNGFYYDFDFKTAISTDDLNKIEDEMKKIVKENIPVIREVMAKKDAIKFFKNIDEPYKAELVADLSDNETITLYRQGDFVDLCAGVHIPSTGLIKAFKLTSITGAYWKGDEHNKMLTRIYGTSFEKKADLITYLEAIEEAKSRDHNKVGRELNIFMTDENIGQGLPLLMPKGAKLFQILQRFVEDEEASRGYVLTKTPYMAKSNLYKISGHWDHYKDGMFVMGDETKDKEVFALRPMTCPFQYTIYNNGLKSYRDLPIRYAETSTLFRNESSGEMHGLIRLRQFTISEGHIVFAPNQLEQEFSAALDLAVYMMKCLGLYENVSFRFSCWDPNNREKYINQPEIWERAEANMKQILDKLKINYNEEKGEAAFYGPKLDIQIRNVHGKEDTLITLQIDMFLAENFDMNFIDEKGEKIRPYIIHRTSIGCYERTMALLIEKYKGAFPVWMSPVQVKVMALTDRTTEDVKQFAEMLQRKGIRAEVDVRNEKIGYKIREAQLEKIPYMIIIGDKEKENEVVAVRNRKFGDLGVMTKDEFIKKISEEIETKEIY